METVADRHGAIINTLTSHGSRIRRLNPGSVVAQCPAHDDREPSMTVTVGEKAVLIHCHAGCQPADILDVLGLHYSDLWPDDGTRKLETPQTWKAYQQAVRAANQRDHHRPQPDPDKPSTALTWRRGPVEAIYTYRDADGVDVIQKLRYPKIDLDTGEIVGKTFSIQHYADGEWNNGIGPNPIPIYNLPAVNAAVKHGIPIIIVEGEKDADRLNKLGHVATTLHSTTAIDIDRLRPLTGCDITLIVDRDQAGDTWARELGDVLTSLGCRLMYRQAAVGKDVSDHLNAGHTINELIPYTIDRTLDLEVDNPINTSTDLATISSWTPRPILDITRELAKETLPDIFTRTDGKALHYRGRINGFIGEAESGKTWLALHAVAQQLNQGQTVIWTDFEDSPNGILARLRALNLTDTQLDRFLYLRPEETYGPTGRTILTDTVNDLRPSLIITDGVNAAMTLLGLDINSNNDASYFFQHLLQPLTRSPDERPGAAVVYIDHVAKNKETRGKGALGAGAKRAMTTGCTISVGVKSYPAPGRTGELRLRVDKDRPGLVRAEAVGPKAHLGLAIIESFPGNNVTINIKPPSIDDHDDDDDIPLPEPRKAMDPKELAKIILSHRYADRDDHGNHKPISVDNIRRQLRENGHSAGNELGSQAVAYLKMMGCIDEKHRWIRPLDDTKTTP